MIVTEPELSEAVGAVHVTAVVASLGSIVAVTSDGQFASTGFSLSGKEINVGVQMKCINYSIACIHTHRVITNMRKTQRVMHISSHMPNFLITYYTQYLKIQQESFFYYMVLTVIL